MKKLALTLIAVFAACVVYAQKDIKVEVHRVVSEGEQFNLTFIIEGENSPSDFSWTPSSDFQLLWGPQTGKSTSISIVNGKRTKSVQVTYTYVLRAMSQGKFTISPASADVKGKPIFSKEVVIEVIGQSASATSSTGSSGQASSQPGTQTASQTNDAGDIFLVLAVSNTNAVVGEPITASVKLYQRVNVAGFESASFPTFNGFWSQELVVPNNIEFVRESYNGQIYNAALLREYVLIPQHEGTLTIEPAELVCLVQVRASSGGSSIFDAFFNDIKTIRQKVLSKSVNVNVRPLPSGAPASFGGGVGEFSMTAKLSKDNIKTHEAASLIVTVTGRGNVALLEAPKVNFPSDVEVYDTKISDNLTQGGLVGSKIYEFPFIPRSYGEFEIEPIKYSYFDVRQNKYVTLQTEPITLNIEKGEEQEDAGQVVVPIVKKDVKNIGTDIRFINVNDHDLAAKGSFFIGSLWFWVSLATIILLAVFFGIIFRSVSRRRADVVGTKHRKATKMALQRLKQARAYLKNGLQIGFYEELHKALLGFVSDKLNIPAAELFRDNITQALKQRGVAQEYIDSFVGLLDACEYARYAPDSGNEAMSGHYNTAVDVISAIDSDMKTNKTSFKSGVVAVLMLMALPFTASAQQSEYVDSLWNSAAQAYTEGRWHDAVDLYEQIGDLGLESSTLYYNTGNAYYKSGDLPHAVLNYERALKLDPSHNDASYNLQFVNGMIQDQIDHVPAFILAVWTENICRLMDSDAWAITFLVLLGLSLAMFLMFLLSPSEAGRKTGFCICIVSVVLAAASISFSLWQKNDYEKKDGAVVMKPVASVKSSPSSESSQNLFVLHEGTKVFILDQVGSWHNVELADGRQGWIRTGDIEII